MALDYRSQLIKLMAQLRFKRQTALVYTELLTIGPMTLERIINKTQLSLASATAAQEQLLQLRLTAKDQRRERIVYYATDPSISWISLIADLVWSTGVYLDPLHTLPDTDNSQIEHLRMLCTEIRSIAIQIYKPQVAALQHKERDAPSDKEYAQLTCECIGQATKSIAAVSKSPRLPQLSSFWSVLTDRIDNGVHYSRIVDIEELIEHGLAIVARDMDYYKIDLRVIEGERIQHEFYLIDNSLLCIRHVESKRRELHAVGRITNQRPIIARYLKRVGRYRELAIPGDFAALCLRKSVSQLLELAHKHSLEDIVPWLESMVEFGKFSKYHTQHNWSEQLFSNVERRASAAGLVFRNMSGFLLPRYPVNIEAIRAEFAAMSGNLHLDQDERPEQG